MDKNEGNNGSSSNYKGLGSVDKVAFAFYTFSLTQMAPLQPVRITPVSRS